MRKPSHEELIQSQALASLSILRDDFAVMARLKDDPMFWIRVESGASDRLELTDLMPGSQETNIVAEALRRVMSDPALVREVIPRDVLPDWRNHPAYAVELERRATVARAIVAVAFGSHGLLVRDVNIRERLEKLDIIFTLSDANA